MNVVTQDGEKINVHGDVQMTNDTISYNGKILGRYNTPARTCQVFAELSCCSWNKQSDTYKMPDK